MSTGQTYLTGCVPTPAHRLAAARSASCGLRAQLSKLPPSPPNFDGSGGVTDWDIAGNDRYGDCVFADEANFLRVLSKSTGSPEVVIPAANVIEYARQAGGLNGYNIEQLFHYRATTPMIDSAGKGWTAAGHGAIDWTIKQEVMLSIQLMRSVKLGVVSGPLKQAVAGKNGWCLTGVGTVHGVDHCVSICGYGSMQYLAEITGRKAPLPSGVAPEAFGVALYTWGTIGFLDWASYLAITGEGWLHVTDPARGDCATWDPIADADFAEITGTRPDPGPGPQPPHPPQPPPNPRPRPCPRFRRAASHIARGFVSAVGEFLGE